MHTGAPRQRWNRTSTRRQPSARWCILADAKCLLPDAHIDDWLYGDVLTQSRSIQANVQACSVASAIAYGQRRRDTAWMLRATAFASLAATLCFLAAAAPARPAQNTDPFPTRPSKKGLQVQMIDDALALGVRHATLNCDLTSWPALASMDDDFHFTASDGKEYAFRKQPVIALDRSVKELSDGEAIVYLILLSYESPDPARNAVMLHAKYDKAAKTNRMGAFNTAVADDGRSWFAAVIEFIAQRYSPSDAAHGRVWGYIVGNEVNAHWWWYNMGRVPLEEIASEYERAVRIVHTSVRRSSQNARVYLSFEHHWGTSNSPDKPDLSVRGRDLLGKFAELARERGDFDWHVAYHPYPENLGDPRFWLDKSATPDDASPRITFKNLQVLTTHLARPELLWKGQTRRIILSEQGFHCREELPDGEAVQAAAFCYAWRKVAALPAIDAFILHRHVDHAYEGLNLGLWTHAPDTVSTPGRKRPLYDVFRAADTPEWEKAFAFALPIIGLNDWPSAE